MSLHLIVGCMFSGKTSELIRLIKRERSIHRNVLILNSSLDNRYKMNAICSHNQESIRSISLTRLLDLHDGSYGYANTIIIDEGQFFEDLYDFVMKGLSDNKRLIVSGLNGDSNQQSFGDIYRLYPHMDSIQHLTALCYICKDGSKDKYMAVCRKCLQPRETLS
jgi:thymidine kinase